MPDTPTFPLDPCRFSLLCKNSVLFVRSIYLFWFSLSLFMFLDLFLKLQTPFYTPKMHDVLCDLSSRLTSMTLPVRKYH